ncbi:hypothetical protein DPSP01_010709 [Paraphaeosphaeria sporulosa]|uniref:Uncharacterized protein n=1 Tax=Paraphaeosphaeria sporulosa TaxID=1460663 RepID=A0A177CJ27_9PLEO|nr:uncharacterized protein CC84DRAFT_632139 [Paraphaeosphaeria sporulosa]OAG06982.1 hypothetical protein CC84DRAFT_632139 [Paraphaeosphaeria sporulosa]
MMADNRDPALTTFSDEEKFKDFSEVDSEDHEIGQYPSRTRSWRTVLLIVSSVIVAILIAIVAMSWTKSSHLKYDHCGTNANEARARGCVFETTGFTWLAPECADPATEAEFLEYIAKNEFKYYRTENYTEEVSVEEIRKGNGPGFFVREKYHLTHCLFLMKKLHRMRDKGAMIDGQIMPLHHTEHCMGQNLKALADTGFRKHDVQFSYTKFPYCGKPGGYNLEWPEQGTWTES